MYLPVEKKGYKYCTTAYLIVREHSSVLWILWKTLLTVTQFPTSRTTFTPDIVQIVRETEAAPTTEEDTMHNCWEPPLPPSTPYVVSDAWVLNESHISWLEPKPSVKQIKIICEMSGQDMFVLWYRHFFDKWKHEYALEVRCISSREQHKFQPTEERSDRRLSE